MNVEITAGFVRPLACTELTNRFEAQQRLAKFINIDDLNALDGLCLRGRTVVQQQPVGTPATVCEQLIRDLTICLGEVMMRYVRSDWSIGIEPLGANEYSEPSWTLLLLADGDYRSLQLEQYVTRRFFERTDTSFTVLLDEVIEMAQNVPGLYIGGYGKTENI